MQKLSSFFILIFIGLNSIAQTNLDSLWNVWKSDVNKIDRYNSLFQIALSYQFKSPDTCYKYAMQLKDFSESFNDKSYKRKAIDLLAVSSGFQSKYQESIDYSLESIEISKKINDLSAVAHSFKRIGVCYQNISDFENAKISYEIAIKYSIELDDKLLKADLLHNMGWLANELGDNKTAIDNYLKSLEITKDIQNVEGQEAYTFNNIGQVYHEMGLFDKSLEFLNKSYKISNDLEMSNLKTLNMYNFGRLYSEKGDYELSLQYHDRGLKISIKNSDRHGEILSLQGIGHIYLDLGILDSSFHSYQKALEISYQIDDKKLISSSLNFIGRYFYNRGNFDRSLEFHRQSLEIENDLTHKIGIGYSLNFIGECYHKMKLYNFANESYTKSLKIREEIGNVKGVAECYNNLGSLYFAQNDNLTALDYHHKSLKIKKEIGFIKGEAISLYHLGDIYLSLEDYHKALNYYNSSTEKLKFINSQKRIGVVLCKLGNCLYKMEKYQKAIQMYKESEKILDRLGYLNELLKPIEGLYLLYKNIETFPKALEYHEKFISIKDSLDKIDGIEKEKQRLIHEKYLLKIQSDSIVNADNIKIQHEKVAVKNAENDKLHQQKFFLFGVLSISFVFGAFLFNRFRVTNRQKKLIEKQHFQLEENHSKLEEVHNDITDSIVYAKRIQDATFTSISYIYEILPQSFIYYNPKDVVSGDYYWAHKDDEYVFFTVADCTGHGVPGAFMSMLGNSFLNEMIIENKIKDTNLIMDGVSNKVKLALDQKGRKGESRDGMDMVLCRLNKKTNELMYTGAKNSLLLIRDGEVIEFKGDKRPVGFYLGQNILFTAGMLTLQQNDTLYLFSDGYSDQFGGDKNKKYKVANFKRFLLSIQDENMDTQHGLIGKEFDQWKGDLDQIDDVCVMGVRV